MKKHDPLPASFLIFFWVFQVFMLVLLGHVFFLGLKTIMQRPIECCPFPLAEPIKKFFIEL